ncbi:MAG: LysM peptidoglycan-binding domain-containing protein [Chloroflexota bacterium]
MDRSDPHYAHVDQPAFEQMQIDHNISRVALFFICFLTIGVFYFTLVACPVVRLLPIKQLQQIGQLGSLLNPGGASSSASGQPIGALGGSQIGQSASPSASAAASGGASASPATAPSPSTGTPTAGSLTNPAAPSAGPASSASSPPAPAGAGASPSVSSGSSYTVAKGDTLSSIARKFNTSVQSIASANNIPDSGTIRIGQKLRIP